MWTARRLLLAWAACVLGIVPAVLGQSDADLYVLGIVRDAETDEVIAGADVWFYPAADRTDSPWEPPTSNEAVRRVGPRDRFPAFHGRSDARGAFRLQVERRPGTTVPLTTGWLLVETPDSKSALVERCTVGSPTVVRVAERSRVRVSGPLRDWLWRVQAIGQLARGLRFEDHTGDSIRLPPGRYRFLLEDPVDGSRHAFTIELGSAETRKVTPPSIARAPRALAPEKGEATAHGQSHWSLVDWPDVDLPLDESGRHVLPSYSGVVRLARLQEWTDERVQVWTGFEYDGRRSNPSVRFPAPDFEWRNVRLSEASSGQPSTETEVREVCVSTTSDSTSWIVSRTNQSGRAKVLAPSSDSAAPTPARWRLARTGSAVAIVDAPGSDRSELVVRWRAARSLVVRVSLPEPPLPLATPALVRVDQFSEGFEDARFAATNSRGDAFFEGLAPESTIVSVEHPNYVRAQARVEASDLGEIVRIRLDRGASLRGVVRLPDGHPAAGAIVELRDASGSTASATRLVAADREGRFEFGGLTSTSFLLFAQREASGHTWSARIRDVRPGGDPVAITLYGEDPPLPGSGSKPSSGRPSVDQRR